MSNAAYEKLHKLVAYLMKHGIVSKARLARELGMSLVDFLEEFKDEVEAICEDQSVIVGPGHGEWLFEPE